MKLLPKKLLAAALLVAAAAPALAWDKAPDAKKRLEILARAAKASDQNELASCYAPPFDKEVMQNLLGETIEYEKNLTRLFQTVAEKIGGQEGVEALGDYGAAVSDLRYLCGTNITVESVKEDGETATGVIACKAPDGTFEGKKPLKLVKLGGDDWRVVFDDEEWPDGDKDKFVTELSSALGRWALELKNVDNAYREDRLGKEQVQAQVKTAVATIKQSWFRLRESRAEALEAVKNKAAAAAAEQAKKEAAAKKAIEDEAAKKEAAKKEAARKEALRNAPPPPPPPPAAAKKEEKKKEGEEPEGEKKKEPDNTGMFIVFGVLAVACLVTVGILLSKMKGGKRAGGGGGGGGGRGRRGGRGASGRNEKGSSPSGERGGSKKPGKRGKSKRASADDDEEDEG